MMSDYSRGEKPICAVFGTWCVLLLAIFIGTLFLTGAARKAVLDEGGLVESATVLGYGICLGLILIRGGLGYLTRQTGIVVLITLLGLRELDFDKRFTTMGIFKSRFYVSSDVPLLEKAAAIIFILLLAVCIGRLLKQLLVPFISGIKRRSLVAWGALLAIGLAAVAKSLDGLSRKLEVIGVEAGENVCRHFGALEEVLELGIPVMLFLALLAYFQQNETAPKAHAETARSNAWAREAL